ncbi:MAG: hypothetical protein ABH822_02580 [Patescibacteria group bacterium]
MYFNIEQARIEIDMGLDGLLFIGGDATNEAMALGDYCQVPHRTRNIPFVDCDLFHIHHRRLDLQNDSKVKIQIFTNISPLGIVLHCPVCGWRQLLPSQQVKTIGELASFLEPDDH